MTTRRIINTGLDHHVGRIFEAWKASGQWENYDPTFFTSFGPHDGIKRDLWEGGIRVGALARWPDKIPRGRVSHEPNQFHDWLPAFAELAGLPAPARTDGVSLVPTLTGQGAQTPSRVYVEYFQNEKTPPCAEFAESHRGRVRRHIQALRVGDFMGVRYQATSHAVPFEIDNVVTDAQQTNNLAKVKPCWSDSFSSRCSRSTRPDW